MLVLLDQRIPFNVMDYLFERIKAVAYDQEKSSPFAPHIQKLINHVVKDQKFVVDTYHKTYKPKKELKLFDPKNLQSSKSMIERAKNFVPQATNNDGEGTSCGPKRIEERLAKFSTKEIMELFLKSQLNVNDTISRILYFQDKLRRADVQIRSALNKILFKQGEQLVQEEPMQEAEVQPHHEETEAQVPSPAGQEEEVEGPEATASSSSSEDSEDGEDDEDDDASSESSPHSSSA